MTDFIFVAGRMVAKTARVMADMAEEMGCKSISCVVDSDSDSDDNDD